jgi:hypothetical protein
MREENLSILRPLKQNIEELIAPIEAGEIEFYGEDSHKVQSGLDLLMGELTMVVLLLADPEGTISAAELELLNDMRHVVFGYGIPELNSNEPMELRRQFLRILPDRLLTLDHVPLSVRLLDVYDQSHGTEYANKARLLFVQFSEAMIKADKEEHPIEVAFLGHFRQILDGEQNHES